MSSNAPYPQEKCEEKAAAPTVPAGKRDGRPPCTAAAADSAPMGRPQDTPISPTSDDDPVNGCSAQQQQPSLVEDHSPDVVYATPMCVEASATSPVRTIIESTQTADATAPATTTSATTKQNTRTPITKRAPATNADGNVTITTTRVVALQPCKIVYHYADNTEHTYVLQSSATTTIVSSTTTPAAAAAAAAAGPGSGHGMRGRHAPRSQVLPPSSSIAATAAPMARIPASHGGDSCSLVSFDSDSVDTDEKEESAALLTTTTKPCPSCGCCGCVAAVYKPPEYVADITPANPRIGSPGPVTLFAFGFTTCLYNVHQAGICPMNLTTMGLICFYGGLAQFVGGFFELMNKNTIFCTLDVTYGAFWMATAVTNLVPANENVVADAPKNYMGGFFMLWFFFAATMFASSFKFSYVQMLLNFSVTLNFFLNFLGSFIGSKTLLHVAGFEGIVEGCLATYVGMAFSMRDIYGRSILPLFFQKNFKITEW